MSAPSRKGPVPMPARPPRPASIECLVIPRSASRRLFGCGHKGPMKFDLDLYGEQHIPSTETIQRWNLCGMCFMARVVSDATRCVRCGYIIHPGDRVALYPRLKGDPAWVTKTVDGTRVIGCGRHDCIVMPGAYAGQWSENGFVPALEGGRTLFEISWQNAIVPLLPS